MKKMGMIKAKKIFLIILAGLIIILIMLMLFIHIFNYEAVNSDDITLINKTSSLTTQSSDKPNLLTTNKIIKKSRK